MDEHFFNPMAGAGLNSIITNYDEQGRLLDPVTIKEQREAEKQIKETARIKAQQLLMSDLGKDGSEFLRLHLDMAIRAIHRLISTDPLSNEKILFEVRNLQIVTSAIDQVVGRSTFKDQFTRYAVLEIVTNLLGVALPAHAGGYQGQAPDAEDRENGRA